MRSFPLETPSITVGPKEPFAIEIARGAIGGYEWSVDVDPAQATVSRRRTPSATSAFGARPKEFFYVEPLTTGAFELRFNLARPWEGKEVKSRRIEVRVRERARRRKAATA